MNARILSLAVLVVLGSCATQKEAARPPDAQGEPRVAMRLNPADYVVDEVAVRLDSLAAQSNGDYVHMVISACFGKCDGYVSISRTSPAKFYIYDAAAWRYDESERDDIRYVSRRPLPNDRAEQWMHVAKDSGMMRLANDTTMLMTDQAYIWLRARVDGETLVVNRAYLGGRLYTAGETGSRLVDVYASVRSILLKPLFGPGGRRGGDGQ